MRRVAVRRLAGLPDLVDVTDLGYDMTRVPTRPTAGVTLGPSRGCLSRSSAGGGSLTCGPLRRRHGCPPLQPLHEQQGRKGEERDQGPEEQQLHVNRFVSSGPEPIDRAYPHVPVFTRGPRRQSCQHTSRAGHWIPRPWGRVMPGDLGGLLRVEGGASNRTAATSTEGVTHEVADENCYRGHRARPGGRALNGIAALLNRLLTGLGL